ncbi:MAG: amino acid permease family protein [Bacteroidetes bacterium]|jgi:APA family basic amino acid/polyamine antiporter|nr:amino acid permease family protein [Bacteroidota bacterium]
MSAHKIGFNTAVAIVIANMIGTGVFTSLGFQVLSIESGFGILMLWIVGGVLALCGALTYGEIGSAFPESGGEYNYLSKLYHPSIGFISGWVSVTVGFAAPIAAAAVALGQYVTKIYPTINATLLALTVIGIITAIHSINLKAGGLFQRVFTIVKVVCIIMFVGFGLYHVPQHSVDFAPSPTAWKDIFSTGFAASLIYVTYAYSGWNAATYISGEISDAKKNLPKALFVGTLLVMIVYTLLNFVFLYSVPVPELKGVLEVGYLSANKIFGTQLGQFMSLVIALLLISTISAMVLAGPRVMQSMGNDIKGLSFFAISNKNKVPYVAIIFQSTIAVILVLTSSFQSLITYVGFTLNLFTFLTVLGIFILRYKHKHVETSYKTFLYPVTPVVFLLIILWILINIMIEKPMESLCGLGTVLLGLGIYFLTNKKENKNNGQISETSSPGSP